MGDLRDVLDGARVLAELLRRLDDAALARRNLRRDLLTADGTKPSLDEWRRAYDLAVDADDLLHLAVLAEGWARKVREHLTPGG